MCTDSSATCFYEDLVGGGVVARMGNLLVSGVFAEDGGLVEFGYLGDQHDAGQRPSSQCHRRTVSVTRGF